MDSTQHAKPRYETAARCLFGGARVATLALVGGILCSDPDDAAATPAPSSAPPTSGEPLLESDEHGSDEAASGLPRALVYGAVAGLFLFVAAGVGAHRKH